MKIIEEPKLAAELGKSKKSKKFCHRGLRDTKGLAEKLKGIGFKIKGLKATASRFKMIKNNKESG